MESNIIFKKDVKNITEVIVRCRQHDDIILILFFEWNDSNNYFSVRYSFTVPLRDILHHYFGVSPSPYMTDGLVVLIPPGHPSVGCVETSTLSRGSWWFIWAMWQLAWWSICGNPQREGWGHLMGWGIAQGLNSNILWQDFFWTHPTSFFAFRFFCSKLPLDQQIPLKKIAFMLICSHTHFSPGFPEGRQCCVLAR